ncbi:MAG TPA: peptidoglycan-binding protein [Longimicrobium sp.]|nr:peptidoglycan-binding protein [Longimicrobium sp.]
MAWHDLIPKASGDFTMQRAKGALGRKTVYKLGLGGMDPNAPLTRSCDCSGFVAWSIGIPRQLPPGKGGWLDTDAYWAGGKGVRPGLFTEVARSDAKPGDVYVYPDANGKQGHIGIITEVGPSGPTKIVHCSSGNWKRHGDAVRETDCGLFDRHQGARVMRIDYTALKAFGGGGASPSAPTAPAAPALKHPLLAADAMLNRVARGELLLKKTGGPVAGVAPIQEALNKLSAKYPSYAVDLGADEKNRGFFGGKTEAAIKAFQDEHDIEVDGVVGRGTIRTLDAALLSFEQHGEDLTRDLD